MMRVVFLAYLVLAPVAFASSDSCAAGSSNCVDDATSLIQQSVAVQAPVNRAHIEEAEATSFKSAPPPAKSDANSFTVDDSFVFKTMATAQAATQNAQLKDMQSRQKADNGCSYGTEKDGSCVPAYTGEHNVFNSMGMPDAKGKGKSLLQVEYPRTIAFTQEDHDLIPLHTRLKWERQRRGMDPHQLEELASITDSNGNDIQPSHEPMSFIEEQFPLAVTLHAPAADGCDAAPAPSPGEKPKTGDGFNIDIQKMLTCQVGHAEQVEKDMLGQQKATEATYDKAQKAYSAAIKALKADQDKLTKGVNADTTKAHGDIEAKYPCGFGAKAGAFFGKMFGKDDKAADECIAKRKLAIQDADKAGKGKLDKVVADEQVKKDAIQKTMDDAKDDYDKFKKELRDAKTQKFMLPIVAYMTSDKVMNKLQKVDNFMLKPGEPDAGPDAANAAITQEATTKGINGINDPDAKAFYVKQKLSAVIVPFYNEAVSVAQAALWNALSFVKAVAQESLVGLVGSIPFVGGLLAAIVALVFDAIWIMFQHHVNAALLNLANVVIDKVLDAMVTPIMAELKATKGPVKTIKAADKKTLAGSSKTAQAGVTGPATKNAEAEAKKAAALATGGKTSSSDFVKSMATDAKSDKAASDKLDQSKYDSSASLLQFKEELLQHPLYLEHEFLQTHPLFKDL